MQLEKQIVVIITRFNLDLSEISQKVKKLHLDVAYLKNRFDIFERYYIPSLNNQTNCRFLCFILLHQRTPEYFKEQFAQLSKNTKFTLIPIFTEKKYFESSMIFSYIKNYQYLISARLDNDDCVASCFVEELYKNSVEENYVLSFPHGAVYDIHSSFMSQYIYKENHFLAYVEKVEPNIKTIYNICEHDKLVEKHPHCKFIETEFPMWIENIHGCNISNRLTGRMMSRKVKKSIQEQYAFLEDFYRLPPITLWPFVLEKLWRKSVYKIGIR